MAKKRPLYELKKSSKDNYIEAIAIVDKPAIQSSFYMFAEVEQRKYLFVDEPKKMIAGLALIPNLKIVRYDRDEQGNVTDEYDVMFTAETIEELRNDFMKKNINDAVNFMHVNNAVPENVYLVETFMVESELQQKDLKQRFNIDAPLKSLFVQYHVEDINVFNQIKDLGFHGFSIQGYFDKELVQLNKHDYKENIMNKIKQTIEKFKVLLAEAEAELAPVALVDKIAETGQEVKVGKEGEPVLIVTADPQGNPVEQPCPDGQYVLENGDTIDCKQGVLVSRTAATAAAVAVEPQGKEAPAEPAASGDTKQAMADYPWDTCIKDRLSEGYDQAAAEAICGKIRSENMTAEAAAIALGCKKKEELAAAVSGDTAPAPVDQTPEVSAKTLGDLVDTSKDGEYEISVTVSGGVITEATVSAEQELVKATKLNEQLQSEITLLKSQLKLPVTKPIVNQQTKQQFTKEELAKMTPYERNAIAKGLRIIK
jgi:hypothetical protein